MQTIKRAIILAAGKGKRLYPLTEKKHKVLTRVNGETILDHNLHCLASCGIYEIIIVDGYRFEQIEAHVQKYHSDKGIKFIKNEQYDYTNNILSLWLAKDYFDEDFLLLEADIFFDRELIKALCDSCPAHNYAAVSRYNINMNGTLAAIDNNNLISRFYDPSEQDDKLDKTSLYKTINIYRLSSSYASDTMCSSLEKSIHDGKLQEYYETIFRNNIQNTQVSFLSIDCSRFRWFEIDNLADLSLAEYTFLRPDQQMIQANNEYGGYWRYDFADHCLLYNLYYPPQELIDHLKGRMNQLVRYYPAAQKSVIKFLARYLEIHPECLAVGNGASEFIKIIGENIGGPMVVSTPTFNEYENAVTDGRVIHVQLNEEENFKFNASIFAKTIIDTKAKIAIIISPNNPTSVLVPKSDIMELMNHIINTETMVIVDESFLDFAENGKAHSMLKELDNFPNLVVLKSLSKTHGIGGLRLGYVASMNKNYMQLFQEKLPIWNINGFGEEYLRIFSAFAAEFEESCRVVRRDTLLLYEMLNAIPGIKVIRPDANFVLCKIEKYAMTAKKLAENIFSTYNIYIKECSGKQMDQSQYYFRVASRMPNENKRLVSSIAEVLKSHTDKAWVLQSRESSKPHRDQGEN